MEDFRAKANGLIDVVIHLSVFPWILIHLFHSYVYICSSGSLVVRHRLLHFLICTLSGLFIVFSLSIEFLSFFHLLSFFIFL